MYKYKIKMLMKILRFEIFFLRFDIQIYFKI